MPLLLTTALALAAAAPAAHSAGSPPAWRASPEPLLEPVLEPTLPASPAAPLDLSSSPLAWQEQHLTLSLGTRWLDPAWSAVDQPYGATLGYALRGGQWFHWDFGLSWYHDDGKRDLGAGFQKLSHDDVELSVGLLKLFDTRSLRPYLGLGLSWSYVDARVPAGTSTVRDDDVALGGYARGGLLLPVRNGYVGLDLRLRRFADAQLAGGELDLDYEQVAFVFGYGW